MTTLLGRIPANTFPTLLKIQRANDSAGDFDDPGIDSLLRTVEDGLGNASVLKLSTTQVSLNDMIWPTAAGSTNQVLQVGPSNQLTWVNISSTNVTEGSNLFWTGARFDNAFAAKTTTNLAEGSNQYFTPSRARSSISVSGAGAYDPVTGVITVSGGVTSVNSLTGDVVIDTDDVAEGSNQYFTPSRARSSISVSGDLNYNSTTGVLSFSSAVTSVNTKTGAVSLTSTDIPEGSNQYYTIARARSAISVSGALTYTPATGVISYTPSASSVLSVNSQTGTVVLDSDDIAEGTTNFYFTTPRFDSSFSSKTTTDLTEGTNLYFTNSRASAAAPVQSVFGRTGSVNILSSDVTSALGFTPLNQGGGTMTGSLTLSGDPSSALHAVTKQYVDNLASGLVAHASVATSTTASLTASYSNGTLGVGASLTGTGVMTAIGGVTPVLNDRVLVKNQADPSQNGIYYVAAVSPNWVLIRATDFDNSSTETIPGAFTYVQSGTLAGSAWVLTTTGAITIGTTSLQFSQFAGAGVVTGGTGITVSGNTISISDVGSSGTYTSVTTNLKGQVTSGTNLVATGDATGTASGSSIALTLASVGSPVTSSFSKITTDSKGRVSNTAAVTTADLTTLLSSTYVDVTGDTMTGALNLPTDGLAVGTSQLKVSGGNVGIGLANPAFKLDVSGIINSSSAIYWGAGVGKLNFSGSDAFVDSTGALIARTGGTNERMRITSTGNINIGTGTNNPNNRALFVNGAIGISSNGTTEAGKWYSDGTLAYLDSGSTGQAFYTGGAERLRIDSVGNMGINLVSPTYKLEVGASGVFALNDATNSNKGTLQMTTGGLELYTGAAKYIAFGTDSTERVRVDSDGNVGINTTSPSVKLEVGGQIKSSSGGFVFPDGSVQTTASTSSASSVSMTNGSLTSVTYSSSTTSANQVADSWPIATLRTVNYLVQMTSGSSFQTSTITVFHDGTTAYFTEYGIMTSGSVLATFDVDISSGDARLLMSPTNAVTVLKAVRTSINT